MNEMQHKQRRIRKGAWSAGFAFVLLLSSPAGKANWQTECAQVMSNPCYQIQGKVNSLSVYGVPAPFLSTTLNQFPGEVFPGGNPFSGSSSAGFSASSGGSSPPPVEGNTSPSTNQTETFQ